MPETSRIAEPAIESAETDMLHRRTPLPYRAVLTLRDAAVEVRANSPAVQQGIQLLGMVPEPNRGPVNAEWMIEVEICGDAIANLHGDGVETFAFGPSRSLRMVNGSWFAWTPPATNGVGFAFVCGEEAERAAQLAKYLRTVGEFVSELLDTHHESACFEGIA